MKPTSDPQGGFCRHN